jgi:ribosomal protein S7
MIKNIPKRHHPNKELFEKIINQAINTYRTKLLELELVTEKKVVTPQILIKAVEIITSKEEASKVFHFLIKLLVGFSKRVK